MADQSGSQRARWLVADAQASQVVDVVAHVADGGGARGSAAARRDLGRHLRAFGLRAARRTQRARPAAQLLVDGSDPIVLQAARALAELPLRQPGRSPPAATQAARSFEIRPFYNPERRSAVQIVPGIIGVILTMTMTLFTAVAIVRERERGNLELLITTPVRTSELMLGKIIPYIAIGMFQVTLVLVVGSILFRVPIRGSLIALYVTSLVFVIATLGLGLLISTAVQTQFQAFQLSFTSFLPQLLLSGFMFPFDGMPRPAKLHRRDLPADALRADHPRHPAARGRPRRGLARPVAAADLLSRDDDALGAALPQAAGLNCHATRARERMPAGAAVDAESALPRRDLVRALARPAGGRRRRLPVQRGRDPRRRRCGRRTAHLRVRRTHDGHGLDHRHARATADPRRRGRLTVSGGDASGVFFASGVGPAAVELRNLTVTAGTGVDFGAGETLGGCILSDAPMVLRNVTIRGCSATSAGGGYLGIDDLTLIGSSVLGNHSGESAGGIGRAETGITVIIDSVISDNTAAWNGGGIVSSNTPLSITDSTISGNKAASGGGIFVGAMFASPGDHVILRSTISGNTATDVVQGGGGIRVATDQIEIADSTIANNKNGGISIDVPQYFEDRVIRGTTIAGNTGPMPTAIFYWQGFVPAPSTNVSNTILSGTCSAALSTGGGNIESPSDTCGLGLPWQPTDQVNISSAALNLGKLGPHGGPTRTIPLHSPSVALDAAVGCPPPATDQRGVARPQGAACDVGAFEQEFAEPVPALPPAGVATLLAAFSAAAALARGARRGA